MARCDLDYIAFGHHRTPQNSCLTKRGIASAVQVDLRPGLEGVYNTTYLRLSVRQTRVYGSAQARYIKGSTRYRGENTSQQRYAKESLLATDAFQISSIIQYVWRNTGSASAESEALY